MPSRRVKRRGAAALLALLLVLATRVQTQGVSLEYQVKAVYLLNFLKFITWPSAGKPGPLTICVAGRSPFGDTLQAAIRGEAVAGRMVETRIIRDPQRGCSVVFVPHDADAAPYLEAAAGSPTLTVGEQPAFLAHGGMVNFILEDGSVRFEIDSAAADRAGLRISSQLMRLAR